MKKKIKIRIEHYQQYIEQKGNVFQLNHTPATSENHWAYAVSGQGHCKTSANNRIKIE